MNTAGNQYRPPLIWVGQDPQELQEKFQQRVRQLLEEKYPTHSTFFRQSGFDARQWYRLLTRRSNPTFKCICELAKALDVHPKELFNFEMIDYQCYKT